VSYVIAGYGITVASIVSYTGWLLWRSRKLTRPER
jgi:hypothetical protein